MCVIIPMATAHAPALLPVLAAFPLERLLLVSLKE